MRLEIGSSLPDGVSAGTLDQAEVDISGERTTHIQRVNPNGTPSDNTTVAGRLHREGPLPAVSQRAGGRRTWKSLAARSRTFWLYPRLSTQRLVRQSILADEIEPALDDDILPGEEAPTVTVRVPPDVVEGGNPAGEVTYDVLPSFTALLTTSRN